MTSFSSRGVVMVGTSTLTLPENYDISVQRIGVINNKFFEQVTWDVLHIKKHWIIYYYREIFLSWI